MKVNTGKFESHVREENSETLLKKEERIAFRQSEGAMYTSVKSKGPWYLKEWTKFSTVTISFQFLFRVLYLYGLCSFLERGVSNLFIFHNV